ncbi:MAG: tetratricopeptide repeat protein, partial [Bacteroidota bacterium]
MLKKIKILLFVFLVAGTSSVFAQQSNAELANQYFNTGEFDKAIVYYEKYYQQDPYGAFGNYLKCFQELKDFEGAEKLIKKQQKKFPGDISLRIELGSLYELMGDSLKADKAYADVVKNLPNDVNQIIQTGNAFNQRQLFKFSQQTYLQGRKILKGTYPFSFELADAYAQDGKATEMLNEYVDAIEFNAAYMPSVQTLLQSKIINDLSGNLADQLRQVLLRKIQKNPNTSTFSELLYWLFLQEKDFESAFIQAKSLDKRLGEDGDRLIILGRACASNGEYETAINCFQTVLEKGKESMNYI